MDSTLEICKAFLSFWRSHRSTLLEGELELFGVDANYTMAKAKKDGESITVMYQSHPITVENGEKAYVFNSTR